VRWEIAKAHYNSAEMFALLGRGWEPFAVVREPYAGDRSRSADVSIVYFRRRVEEK
jgi:hypothetical protein